MATAVRWASDTGMKPLLKMQFCVPHEVIEQLMRIWATYRGELASELFVRWICFSGRRRETLVSSCRSVLVLGSERMHPYLLFRCLCSNNSYQSCMNHTHSWLAVTYRGAFTSRDWMQREAILRSRSCL
jgi:hypothetical protein